MSRSRASNRSACRPFPKPARWIPSPATAGAALVLTLSLAAAALPLTGCGGRAGATGETVPLAYVASGANNHVRVIDPDSGETLRRIYSGAGPWRLVPAPDGSRLWIQHWYAGTTAVLDLEHHEIVDVLAFRGPGAFSADGSVFFTFDWPRKKLARIEGVNSRAPSVAAELPTMIKQAYDVAPVPHWRSLDPSKSKTAERLFVAQFDPMAQGPVPRYGSVAALDPFVEAVDDPEEPAPPTPQPETVPTGRSPLRVVPVPGQPFVLTADSGTNGITLINELGDRRALAVCPAPREILLAPDVDRMVVLCWDDRGRHASRVVSFRSDFEARPWPELERESEASVPGGLVAGAFHPDGDRVYAVDRPGGRMVELGLPGLEVTSTTPTGEEPLDVAVVEVSRGARETLLAGGSESRELLREVLARARRAGAPEGEDARAGFRDLSWTETTTWLEDPAAGEGTEGEAPEGEPAEPVERSRTVQLALLAPDALRTELPEGGTRIARGGISVSLDAAGRFWVTPRQDLATTVYNLPNLSVEEAIRHLAGDVPGSRFLRGGLAVDLVAEVHEQGGRFFVLGARPGPIEGSEEAPPSQLWIDADTGLPTNLVEQFPVFETGGHGQGAAPSAAETKFYDFEPVGDPAGASPLLMPRRLERIVDGEWLQHVRLSDFAVDQGLEESRFDPARLGGVEPAEEVLFRREVPELVAASSRASGPGRSVTVQHPAEPIGSPLTRHAPYPSSPPTSGPYLPFTADWGVHDAPVPLPLQVHNLLDGGVALQYDCPEGCPELIGRLEELAGRHDFLVVAPYPWMDARLAATAWGRIATFDERALEQAGWIEEVERFVDAYAGVGHHRPSASGHEASR